MLSRVLDEDPEIEVVGTASNGKLGLAKISQLKPDVVVMDLEMPVMGGLEALPILRREHHRLPVVVFSAQSEEGAGKTLEALALGANAFCAKPTGVSGPAEAMQCMRDSLLPEIRALCGLRGARPTLIPKSPAPTPIARKRTARTRPVEILLIGSSTGGPNALMDVIPLLPADLPVPVVIVQHMPPMFTKMLAKRLDAASQISVAEATHGAPLKKGLAYIAPGDFHMVLDSKVRARVLLNQEAPENSCRPAVDPLFRSAAKHYGASCLAVVLTGMGKDGTAGAKLLVDQGSKVMAQDEETCVVWGMPGHVVRAGLADDILPLKQIGATITRRITRSRTLMPQSSHAIGGGR